MLFSVLLSVTAADIPSIGRFDRAFIPHADLLELFVENVTSKNIFQNKDGSYLPLYFWRGVCCEDGSVVNLQWLCTLRPEGSRFSGSIAFKHLPDTLISIDLRENALHCTLDFCTLPPNLQFAFLSKNDFFGSIDLTGLPETLLQLRCEKNYFRGRIDLTQLPDLRELYLNVNALSGSLDLTALPIFLMDLNLSDNVFSGEIDVRELPESMHTLTISNCFLSGPIRLDALPSEAIHYDFSSNNLSGSLELPNLPERMASLNLRGNAFEPGVKVKGNVSHVTIDLRESGVDNLIDEDGNSIELPKVRLGK